MDESWLPEAESRQGIRSGCLMSKKFTCEAMEMF